MKYLHKVKNNFFIILFSIPLGVAVIGVGGLVYSFFEMVIPLIWERCDSAVAAVSIIAILLGVSGCAAVLSGLIMVEEYKMAKEWRRAERS